MVLETQPLDSRSAVISADGKYRYVLRRVLTGNPESERWPIAWIMLNPSTADGTKDDATIRRVVDFSRRWEFDDVSVYNLFAYRATDPAELSKVADPIGPDNLRYLVTIPQTTPIIAAWGIKVPNSQKMWLRDVYTFLGNRDRVFHLGVSATGEPRHPLMLPKHTPLQEWRLL